MAQKDSYNNLQSKGRVYGPESKMKLYEQIYDGDITQMRAGFYKKTLASSNNTIKSDDTFWKIEAGFEYRSDLISKKFYGTAKYDWIIEDINDIRDPIKDLTIGLKLKIPSYSRVINIV